MPDLLNVAISGLRAHQLALSTTGNNIANINTQGYSRQQTVNETTAPQILGGLAFGTGTQVGAVRRTVNEFFVTQLRNDTAALSHTQTVSQNLDQLDQLFSDPRMGLNTALDSFFASLQVASNEPTSAVVRQALLSDSQRLVNRFHTISEQLSAQDQIINNQIDGLTGRITLLARGVADLNKQITEVAGASGNQPAGLVDQRDELLRQMSELVGISVVQQDNLEVNVFIGNGQALVLGPNAFKLATVDGKLDSSQRDLVVVTGNLTARLKSDISGGVLGGLLEFRDGPFDDALNSMGRMALALSQTMNDQHRLGMDLAGNLGGDYFQDINSAAAVASRTISASANSIPQDQQVAVTISDIDQLDPSDYRIIFTGTNSYEITRLRDGKTNSAIAPSLSGNLGGLPAVLSFDGLDVAFNRPSGNFVAGDSFILQPTRVAASQIQLAVTSAKQIALASPVRTGRDINNAGSGVISAGLATDTSAPLFTGAAGQLSPPLLIQFTSATTYDVLDNSVPGAPVPLAPPLTGLAFPVAAGAGLLPASFGIDITLSGQPAAGDTFTVDFNAGGFQDNRNALAMVNLQNVRILDGGTTSLVGAYGKLMQEVGTRAAEARMNEEAGTILLEQSQARRDAVSGVNLDEEAANLIKFELAYNASAQVISVARNLFDTLMNAVR